MKKDLKKYAEIAAIFATALFVVYILIHNINLFASIMDTAIGSLKPFLIGCAMAYVVGILMTKYESIYFPKSRKKIVEKTRRPVCLILALGLIVLAFVLIVKIILPQLILCMSLIVEEVPKVAEKIYAWLMKQEEIKTVLNNTLKKTEINWREIIASIANILVTGAGGVMNAMVTMISMTFSMVVQLVVAVIFAIYLLLGKENLIRQVKKAARIYVKEDVRRKTAYVLRVANDTFKSFVVGQCTEAVIIGCLCALGMKLFGFPYAGMTGTVVGLTALLPIVGAYIGAAVGAFMICTVSPMDAVLFLIFLIILQQLEGNIIYPRVVGTSIGLPGIWVLFSVTVCGGIWGITGMLLGVPVMATIYKLLRADVQRKTVQESIEEVDEEPQEKHS